MKLLSTAATLAACLTTSAVLGQTVFVNEDFNSYADQNALEAVWTPDSGDGNTPAFGSVGILLPTADTATFPEPNNSPPGIDGNAIGGVTGGGVSEYNGSAFDVAPSATENVVLTGDIFTDGVTGNWRQTIGLRNDNIDRDPGTFGDQFGLNLIEMGLYNAATCDPTAEGCIPGQQADTDPFFIEATNFAVRTVLFQFGTLGTAFVNGEEVGELVATPNYQFFQLDPALDLPTSNLPSGAVGNEDGLVDIADIGEGWHTFTATISETSVLFELDLFRDGINNVTGSAEVDASLEYEIGLSEDPSNPGVTAGFTSLRVGGPSGITGNSVMAYDNISLETVLATTDPDPFPGDANGDGTVDLLDLDILGSNFGTPSGATFADGDFNGDGAVDLLDLDILGGNFGNSAPAFASAIPEPTAALLALVGLSALARRR